MRPPRLVLQLLLQSSVGNTQDACLHCGFGNISHWGPLSQEFIENKVQHLDVVSLSEHHIPSDLMHRIKKVATSVHRRCFFTGAASSGRSEDGTSGGGVALPLVHLRLLPLMRYVTASSNTHTARPQCKDEGTAEGSETTFV